MLVNMCHIGEISIQKGLKQLNLLTHFLFLLVVEGLRVSLKKVVLVGCL